MIDVSQLPRRQVAVTTYIDVPPLLDAMRRIAFTVGYICAVCSDDYAAQRYFGEKWDAVTPEARAASRMAIYYRGITRVDPLRRDGFRSGAFRVKHDNSHGKHYRHLWEQQAQ